MNIYEEMRENWPAPVVARKDISKFSGGLIAAQTLANRDSLRSGPAGRIRVGRNIVYRVDTLVEWLCEVFPAEELDT